MTGPRLLGLWGTASVKIQGACPQDCLWRMAQEGIRFRDLRQRDELTLELTIPLSAVPKAEQFAKKTMCQLEVLRVSGVIPAMRAMGLRVLWVAGLLGLMLLIGWIQTHVMFLRVEGNTTVPTEKILQALEEEGVRFGTAQGQINLQVLKNHMLRRMPELSWITINHRGSTAEVVVRERREKPVISPNGAPANVVAKKTGLVERVEVTGGTGMVAPGDLVEKGTLLISGVTNLDRTTLISRGEGEIYARTWTKVRAVAPDNGAEKCYTGREKVRWSLTLGKKTINFYKTSGIFYGDYDKIMESKELALPGGFSFPVRLTKLVFREYTPKDLGPAPEPLLESAVQSQLLGQMTAGEMLTRRRECRRAQGGTWLEGVYECREEIGVPVEIEDGR